ncbi:MAG TPA: SDR family oxidoreductase [Microthrixaceae bacterium]|nr:SDR family oxidoreductase [Microthrixaceae bacterium]
MKVVVIGGHGKVALQLQRILAADGQVVTSLFRNPEHSTEVAATGAVPVVADVEALSTDELAELLAGQDAVIWTAGAGGGDSKRTYAIDRDAAIRSMDAAAQAGVKRYVMVSYFGAGPDHGVPSDNSFFAYAEAKAAADTYLKNSELDWTILGPSALTLEPGTGRIDVRNDNSSGQVPREDVARAAAAVLAKPSTIGRVIDFNTGDTPIEDALAN